MNEEDIFDSFPGIGKKITSDIVRAAPYLHSRDIVHRDIKPANVLVPNSHYKSYKQKNWKWRFAKNLLSVNLVIWGLYIYMYIYIYIYMQS